MTVKSSCFEKIRRPRLIVQAARIASATYRRDRDLARLLKAQPAGSEPVNIRRLSDIESDLDQSRRAQDSTYSISRHVEVLAALLAELQGRLTSQPG